MKQVNNVKEFLKILERYKGYEVYYRGQAAKYTSITASITRDQGYMLNEHNIYHEPINMRKSQFQCLNFPIERLAKMQHYSFPTRLIDVTVLPLIALYFAVEDTESECAALVYIYIQPSKELHSKQIQLLSLLATMEDYDLTNIQKHFQQIYNDTISNKEILALAQETAFVQFSESLIEDNNRLQNQKGTFAICGNEVKNGEIQRNILPLDSVKPSMILHVPYEHKLSVKKELDHLHEINTTLIYPELPAVAKYIKEKYKEENISIDGTYSIMDVDDISYPGENRVSIKITLTKLLHIQKIHKAVKTLIEEYNKSYDVVLVFVAKNGDDYIMYNWVLRAQWIRPSLPQIKQSPLRESDGTGYSWQEGTSYSVMADYNDKYVFDDDKNLYVYNQKVYTELLPIYEKTITSFQTDTFETFLLVLNRYKEKIREVSLLIGDFGVSKNKEFNDFLGIYDEFANTLDNIPLWASKDHLNKQRKKHQIKKCFQEIEYHHDHINRGSPLWRKKIGLTQSDYDQIDPYNLPERRYQFVPTIPLNPDALNVQFDVQISQNPDNTVHVFGTTNLYDHANLLVSIRKASGLLCGGSKSTVMGRAFDFGVFSNKGNGYKPGDYKASISLSLPSIQSKEFQDKAGIEYQNLTGPYVNRSGPTLNYETEFTIKHNTKKKYEQDF